MKNTVWKRSQAHGKHPRSHPKGFTLQRHHSSPTKPVTRLCGGVTTCYQTLVWLQKEFTTTSGTVVWIGLINCFECLQKYSTKSINSYYYCCHHPHCHYHYLINSKLWLKCSSPIKYWKMYQLLVPNSKHPRFFKCVSEVVGDWLSRYIELNWRH